MPSPLVQLYWEPCPYSLFFPIPSTSRLVSWRVHIFPYDWIDFPECRKIGSQDKKLLEVGFLSILPKKIKIRSGYWKLLEILCNSMTMCYYVQKKISDTSTWPSFPCTVHPSSGFPSVDDNLLSFLLGVQQAERLLWLYEISTPNYHDNLKNNF